MRSHAHALLSLFIGAAVVLLADFPDHPALAFGVAIAVGVGIDLDHFAIARLRTGSWAAVRRCLDRPSIVLLDQDAIFDDGDVGTIPRLLSHHLVGGVAVVAAAIVAPGYALLLGLVVYVHIVADLVHDLSRAS